jgi:arylsulfatase A-like enzyme
MPVRRLRALVLVALAGCLVAPACSRPPAPAESAAPATRAAAPAPKARPDILLVVVDTLRADRLGLLGARRPTTPALDARLRDGLVFEHATTPVPFTSPAVMSLLTGRYPQHHRVRLIFQRLAPEVPTLPEALAALGYRTAAVVSNMVITDEATGLGSRFGYYDDYVDEPVRWAGTSERPDFERDAARTTDAALAWLERAALRPGPRFFYLHYMDPHAPYTPPANGAADFRHPRPAPVDLKRLATASRLAGVTDGLEYVDRYDEEVAFADREIGRFLDAYDRALGLDKAVVVFTADHGETLLEPGRQRLFAHGFGVWEEQVRVPLVLRAPGVAAGRRADPVSLLDVLPTLLELAGGPPLAGTDGRSLLAAPEPSRELLFEGSGERRGDQIRAVERAGHKWVITTQGGRELPGGRLYFDLGADALEASPLAWAGDSAPASLLQFFSADPDPSGLPAREAILLGRRLSTAKIRPEGLPVVGSGADEEARKKLEALGYL